jgi:O-antigen/teichoic acid export membrane protein
VLIGKQKIKESNHLVMIQTLALILSLLLAFMVFRYNNVDSYIYSLYVSIGASMIVSIIYTRRFVAGLKMHTIKEYIPVIMQMFRYGFQNQVAHITQMLSFRMSFYILESYKGLAALGVYSNGISIAESIWLVAKSMSLVQYSWVSNSEDRQASARLTIQLSKIGVLLSLLLILPLLLLPVSGYTFIFGKEFSGVKPVIWMLLPGVLIYNFSILFGHYYSGTGRYRVNTIISSIGLVVSLILYYTLIPIYSINGAGIATSISYFVTTTLFLWYFSKEYKGWTREMIPSRNDFNTVMSEIRKAVKSIT